MLLVTGKLYSAILTVLPYLMYDAVDDNRTRPEHASWDGIVLPVDAPWWDTHMPLNGWGCRCGVIQMDENDLADNGLEVSQHPDTETYNWKNPNTNRTEKIPVGIDAGFDFNIGQARLSLLVEQLATKVSKNALSPDIVYSLLSSSAIQATFPIYIANIFEEGRKPQNLTFPVGSFSEKVTEYLDEHKIEYPSLIIQVQEKSIVGKKLNRKQKKGNALSRNQWKRISKGLLNPRVVFFDTKLNNLVYVYKDKKEFVKVAISQNTAARGKRVNSLRTAQTATRLDIDNQIRTNNMVIIQGSW